MRDNAGPISPAAQVRTFLVAALLTYACGVLLLVGFILVNGDGAGIVLGLLAALFTVLVWRGAQGKVFPRDASTRSVVLLALYAALITLLVVAMLA